MSSSDGMLKRLQPFQRKSGVYKAIFDAEVGEFNSREAVIDDLQKQMLVDTATWALSIYEAELGIPIDTSKSYEERRSVIKSKMRNQGKVSLSLIKAIVDAYTGDSNEVAYDGRIYIYLNRSTNFTELRLIVDEIKPAHLAVNTAVVRPSSNTLFFGNTLSRIKITTINPEVG